MHMYACTFIKAFYYLFADDLVYMYDNVKDEIYDGWPKKIRDVYRAKPDTDNEPVPDNLDTVFYDIRDKNLYFFKDDMVSK